MKASNSLWREQPIESPFPDLVREIEIYETEIELRKQGKMDEKLFAETRLRRGAYGQRYDNGQRWDGKETQTLSYPSSDKELTKGVNTVWDAPGMQRIKVPFGGMDPRQLEVMAELAEEYSDGIAHVTTRQDFQLHFVHVDDTPALMRRLAAVGITTREACGNSVRNVTACPFSGVCSTESFDVTPYAKGLAYFLLGHPDVQDFGRKFKVAFSGCKDEGCGLVNMHDMGAIAVKRIENGIEKRGFELYVGGGLGTVPHQAKLFDAFLPEEELLPTAQAISRVFARLGEKKNRNRARIKFLVAQLGIEEFKRIVLEERATLQQDPRWTVYLSEVHEADEKPLRPAQALEDTLQTASFQRWYQTNIFHQKQQGYVTATITLPLGDITADQLRAVADISRLFTNGAIRTTVDQNIVLRWISEADLPKVYAALEAIGLGQPGAGTIVDITSCPGTDTCKLGISASRGLAGELRQRLAEKSHTMDEAIQNLHIKVSGCFNSCGQHHVADLGFYGVSRHSGNFTVPHFQVVLGGEWTHNGGSYGLAMGAVPAKRIPEVVERLTGRYVSEREKNESFKAFIQRIGKVQVKNMLDDLTRIPSHDEDPTLYTDWGDNREFTIGDIGVGECAGEIVSHAEFGLAAAERQVFEAQVLLDENQYQKAGETAYESMYQAALTLVEEQFFNVPKDPDRVAAEFRTRFYDTKLFWDEYAGGKFGHYYLRAHEKAGEPYTPEEAHRRVEEAQLVIEAAHSCYRKLRGEVNAQAIVWNLEEQTMNIQHLNIKFYLENPESINLAEYSAVFNTWIQKQRLEELLIDVADYLHVYHGPGILLIGHEADYSLDNRAGRLGLLYNRKEQMDGTSQEKLAQAVRAALTAAQILEKENNLKFNGSEVQLIVNDRLLVPNSAESYSALESDLNVFFNRLYEGTEHKLTHQPDSRERFTVDVKTEARFDVDTLLKNLSVEVAHV